jgi:ribokinase
MSNRKPIVVIGSLNMDLVSHVPRIPLAGETIQGGAFATFPGGKGANQAVAAARLGWPVCMIGRVGNDSFGIALQESLQEAGVDVSRVCVADMATGVASILVAEAGENCIVISPGANGALTPESLTAERDAICSAGMVLMQLEVPMDTVLAAALLCEEFGVPLMLDPAPATSLPDGLLQRIAWFTPNETEARFYAPSAKSSEDTFASLRVQGASGVILKLGSSGAYVAAKDFAGVHISSFLANAIDTTAAGDAFNGAFAVATMQGLAPTAAARFANAAAAISVTRHGAQSSMPSMDEVLAMLG